MVLRARFELATLSIFSPTPNHFTGGNPPAGIGIGVPMYSYWLSTVQLDIEIANNLQIVILVID